MLTQVATPTENKQPPTTETPTQSPEANTAERQELLSPKFAALARKEKQLLAEKMRWQQERTQWEKERQELDSLRAFKNKFESSPLDVIDPDKYQKITEAYLAQPNPELRPLLAKIQQLEEGQKTFLTQAEQQQKQQYDAAVKQIHSDATRLVSTDPAFEVLKELGNVDDVVSKITDHYNETGELKEIEEAAREVQEHFTQELAKLFKLPSIQKLLQTPATTEAAPTEQPEVQQAQKPLTETKQPQPTLSTRIVQSSATAKPATAKERRDRAIKAFLGQLNT